VTATVSCSCPENSRRETNANFNSAIRTACSSNFAACNQSSQFLNDPFATAHRATEAKTLIYGFSNLEP
jgi:hypothetical protein